MANRDNSNGSIFEELKTGSAPHAGSLEDIPEQILDANDGEDEEAPPVTWRDFFRSVGRTIEIGGLLLQHCKCCCCNGDDKSKPKKDKEPPSGVPGEGYAFSHVTFEGEVSRHWISLKDLPKNRNVVYQAALAVLKLCMKKLKDSSVMEDLNNQLAADSKKHGKKIEVRIKIEIQEDNFWKKINLAAITFSGDPATVFINGGHLANLPVDAICRALIHEFLHAKNGAYVDQGLPAPYPKGHDDPGFKQKLKELEKKAGVYKGP